MSVSPPPAPGCFTMRQATARTAPHPNAPASEDRSRTVERLRAALAHKGVALLETSAPAQAAPTLREALHQGLARGEALRILNAPQGGGLTWAMRFAAERAQHETRWLLWIDGPRSFHAGVAAESGLPLERVLIGHLPDAASLFPLLEIAAQSGVFSMIVLDAPPTWPSGGGRFWSRCLPQLRRHRTALIWLAPATAPAAPALAWRLEPDTHEWTLRHQHRQEPLSLDHARALPACLELYRPPRALPGRRLLIRQRHPNRRAQSLAARSSSPLPATQACAPAPDAC